MLRLVLGEDRKQKLNPGRTKKKIRLLSQSTGDEKRLGHKVISSNNQ